MRIMITGGAGYIGSVATRTLLAAGHRVVVFDNLSQGHAAALPPDCPLVVGDLNDRSAIDAAIRQSQPEVVMHFAANSLVGESTRDPFKYLGDNVQNAMNLFRSMEAHGVRRVIFSSTANLFGRPGKIPIDEGEAIVPGSPYGESKATIERALDWLARTKGWKYVCLRYFNAAGATAECGEDHRPETHLIPLILEVAAGQRPNIEIFGVDYPAQDGTCVRDYIHIQDLVSAHVLALDQTARASGIYNLGNGLGFSVRQVIEAARRVTKKDIPVTFGPARVGDLPTLVAGSDRIGRELGWAARTPRIEDIIESAWRWKVDHPHGYES